MRMRESERGDMWIKGLHITCMHNRRFIFLLSIHLLDAGNFTFWSGTVYQLHWKIIDKKYFISE